MQICRWWLVLIAPVCGLGCSRGESLASVEGKVVIKQQPAEGVVVTFHRKGADPVTTTPPVGLTDKEGTFTLSTGTMPGAAAGEYVATMVWPKEIKRKNASPFDGPGESRDELGGHYIDPGRSPFKVEVKAGVNKLEPFVVQ